MKFASLPILAILAAAPLALSRAPAQDKQEPKKEKPVFDEKADAKLDVEHALARAKKENKRVLLEWGANW